MANFANSIGYRLEKLHTGMIVYLCELWNEGTKKPLGSFLSYLNVRELDAQKIDARREYKNIDLVIFDPQQRPLIAIEMKVDNHESKIDRKEIYGVPDYQTLIYPQLVPECEHFLYVTLGVGEHYRAPYGERFDWVRIDRFLRALEAMPDAGPFVEAWIESVPG